MRYIIKESHVHVFYFSAPKQRKFYFSDDIKGNEQYLLEIQYFVKLIKMENKNLKLCLIYELWFFW